MVYIHCLWLFSFLRLTFEIIIFLSYKGLSTKTWGRTLPYWCLQMSSSYNAQRLVTTLIRFDNTVTQKNHKDLDVMTTTAVRGKRHIDMHLLVYEVVSAFCPLNRSKNQPSNIRSVLPNLVSFLQHIVQKQSIISKLASTDTYSIYRYRKNRQHASSVWGQFWHKHGVAVGTSFGRRFTGNDIVASISVMISPLLFSPLSTLLKVSVLKIQGICCLDSGQMPLCKLSFVKEEP